MSHPWICKRSKEIEQIRKNITPLEKFEAFSTTDYKSPKHINNEL